MRYILNVCKCFAADEAGLETVEWGVVGGLIVAALVTVVTTLGKNVLTQFTNLSTEVPAS